MPSTPRALRAIPRPADSRSARVGPMAARPVPPGVLRALERSPEPAVRYRWRRDVLSEDPGDPSMERLAEAVRRSRRVRRLLAGREPDGRLRPIGRIYAKWYGAHWVLGALAEIGYPAGDEALRPAAEQVADFWSGPRYFAEYATDRRPLRGHGVPCLRGRYRRCASQQGMALWAIHRLGLLEPDPARALVDRLAHWQWPDGGWNCDPSLGARHSSFHESWLPLRGLGPLAGKRGLPAARAPARRAAEFFLRHRLFRSHRSGAIAVPAFARLHCPRYWHYDFLGGLLAIEAGGGLADPRARDALDRLEASALPNGGWSAVNAFSRRAGRAGGRPPDPVDWSTPRLGSANAWATLDALEVLRAAGRFRVPAN